MKLNNCTHSAHGREELKGKCLQTGAPGEIRTPDLLLRRQSLYPAELRARTDKLVYRAAGKPSMPRYKVKPARRDRTVPRPPRRFAPEAERPPTRQIFSY